MIDVPAAAATSPIRTRPSGLSSKLTAGPTKGASASVPTAIFTGSCRIIILVDRLTMLCVSIYQAIQPARACQSLDVGHHSKRDWGGERGLLISDAASVASPCSACGCGCQRSAAQMSCPLTSWPTPRCAYSLTSRSGSIEIEIEYRVDPAKARLFCAVMQHFQLSRQRNGAYGWSIARDIADPELWTERYHCPTWHDYLRPRSRSTASTAPQPQTVFNFVLGPNSRRRPSGWLCHAGRSLWMYVGAVADGMRKISYAGYRFPPEVIHQAI